MLNITVVINLCKMEKTINIFKKHIKHKSFIKINITLLQIYKIYI